MVRAPLANEAEAASNAKALGEKERISINESVLEEIKNKILKEIYIRLSKSMRGIIKIKDCKDN
jgi:hypothetical protein